MDFIFLICFAIHHKLMMQQIHIAMAYLYETFHTCIYMQPAHYVHITNCIYDTHHPWHISVFTSWHISVFRRDHSPPLAMSMSAWKWFASTKQMPLSSFCPLVHFSPATRDEEDGMTRQKSSVIAAMPQPCLGQALPYSKILQSYTPAARGKNTHVYWASSLGTPWACNPLPESLSQGRPGLPTP